MTSVQIIHEINLNNPNINQDLWHNENVLLVASQDHKKEKYLHTYVTNNTYKTSKQHFFFYFIHINHNYTESLLISPVFKDPIKHDTIILNLAPKQFNGLGMSFLYILQNCMIKGSYF
jgi:hypothetical protein